jgi:hypothetical protein
MPEEAERPGFLSRWSRRKRGEEPAEPETPPTQELAPAEAALPEAAPLDLSAPQPIEAQTPDPEFDLASLPPIETLDAGSDFSIFLKPGVPQALRTAALRKAWVADPLIRDYMSPLDYAWDFNTPGGLPYGFSNVLAETGEALRKLISQAIGDIEPEDEKPEPVVLAETAPPALEIAAEAAAAEAMPEEAIRLTPLQSPVISPAAEEMPPPPRRRHGSAIPA